MVVSTVMPERRANGLGRGTSEVTPVHIDPIICACGCGQSFVPARLRATRPQRFISGHQNRVLRKAMPKTLSAPRRRTLYTAAGYACQKCGLSMAEQIVRFGRSLEIHHINHDHNDNSVGNHEVLCTACHNHESLAVRDEAKKSATFRARRAAGEIRMWSEGQTKETDPRVAALAEKLKGRVPWNKKISWT